MSIKKTIRRLTQCLAVAIVVFLAVFVLFNILYILWAVKCYPHANSMAGFAAFIYGIPVGGVAAVIASIAYYAHTTDR